jgi:hypothetical protein
MGLEDSLTRNVGAELPFYDFKIPKERRSNLHRDESLKSHDYRYCYQTGNVSLFAVRYRRA